MKCKYCGAEISLEENICSYCGQPNEQALKHVRDMEHFKKRYERTEKDVVGRTKGFAAITARAVILTALIIATIIVYFISENAYSMPENARRKKALRAPDDYIKVLDGYLENGEYTAFSAYINYHNIPVYKDSFEKYSSISYLIDYYTYAVGTLEALIMHGDDESFYKWGLTSAAGRAANGIINFYEYADEENYRYPDDNEEYIAYFTDMKKNMDCFLMTYFDMDEAELEHFLSLSENRMSAYLEEAFLNED